MQIQDAAIEYSEQGFSVIPIRPGWKKKPLVKWEEFQGRRATTEEISGWFQKWPDANIGIVTGSISGIVAIDADSDDAKKWMTETLPATGVYQETSRGKHAFYKPNGHPVKTRAGVREKIDIRGDGGYVVIAPSIHETGKKYKLIFTAGFNGWDDLTPLAGLNDSPQSRAQSQRHPETRSGFLARNGVTRGRAAQKLFRGRH